MFKANINYSLLPESYLFSEVGKRIRAYQRAHPEKGVVRMDIGDVSLPLPQVVVDALCNASREMGCSDSFHGYGPEQGYPFLREAIALHDYSGRGISGINADDIFISDGAKSDLGNIGDIFGPDLKIAVTDPGYPVYADSNVLSGRGGLFCNGRAESLVYLECDATNGFIPRIPSENVDVIYLCYPNNPTGAAITHAELKKWIDYALNHKALIIFDSAYEAYVRSKDAIRSVYEIKGAEKCAIELRSFSKTAGFTGVRCGYTVVPESLQFSFPDGSPASLNKIWLRRQSTKFNGVGYIIQKAAESLYTPAGQHAIKEHTDYYLHNAGMLRDSLLRLGWEVVGGVDSPYVWTSPKGNALEGKSSWEIFQFLLESIQISSTPGSGFGKCGDGRIRFTGFNTREKTEEAISRLSQL